MSEFTTKFRDAFASRASHDDTSYCAPIAQETGTRPEVCKDLVEIAANSYISENEIATFGQKWKDGAAMLKEIGGNDGNGLMWARINYLKEHAVTQYFRWDASDADRIKMIQEMQRYDTSATFPALVEILKERTGIKEGPVQDAAREALAHMAMAPDNQRLISAAIESVNGLDLTDDAYDDALDEALHKITPKIQLDAIAADDVVAALSDPDAALRWDATQILYRMGKGAKDVGFVALAKATIDTNRGVRDGALMAMYRMTMGEQILYAGHKIPPVADAAAPFLVRSLAMMGRAAMDPDQYSSSAHRAATLLTGCSAKAIEAEITDLVSIFTNPLLPDNLRWTTVSALDRDDLRHPLAIPAMVAYLKTDISVCTSNALVNWGDTAALVAMIPEIEKIALNSRLETEPRFQALFVLNEIARRQKTNQSFSVVMQALRDENSQVRGVAFYCLRERYEQDLLSDESAREAQLALRQLQKNDTDLDIRNSANSLLQQWPLEQPE